MRATPNISRDTEQERHPITWQEFVDVLFWSFEASQGNPELQTLIFEAVVMKNPNLDFRIPNEPSRPNRQDGSLERVTENVFERMESAIKKRTEENHVATKPYGRKDSFKNALEYYIRAAYSPSVQPGKESSEREYVILQESFPSQLIERMFRALRPFLAQMLAENKLSAKQLDMLKDCLALHNVKYPDRQAHLEDLN